VESGKLVLVSVEFWMNVGFRFWKPTASHRCFGFRNSGQVMGAAYAFRDDLDLGFYMFSRDI